MCGFVAVFRPGRAEVDPVLLDRMTDAIAHRGPDGRGVFRTPGCGLGHRRLSIIDLEGGAQPLFSQEGKLAIVFNGEVYNYSDVKPSLPGPWKTASDTEVFLRSFEVNGLDGLKPLVGMWGAAIWSENEQRLTVIRDRIGKKPVYYVELTAGGFAFASELRALLLLDGVGREVDPSALDQLLTYRFVPGPRTMFKQIKKLPPGHAAQVDASGLRIVRYWRPTIEQRPIDDREAEDRFLEAFDRSVRLRMVSDVPVGIFLSGGLDSAAVLDAMRTPSVHAFTVAFEGGEADDETAYAAETAALYGARHHTLRIGPHDYATYFDTYALQLEEPVLNDSAIATHFLSKLARQHVKVVLSGQGADEPLAGYDRYKGEWLSAFTKFIPSALDGPISRGADRLPIPEKQKRALRSLQEPDDLARALRIYAVFTEGAKRNLMRAELSPAEATDHPIRIRHAEAPGLSPLGRMLYTDTRVWLVDDLLLVADKLSMAHGLELRTPFLDHNLIELLESFPDDQKLRLSARGLTTKFVHRRAMGRRLPPAILSRKKRGFTNPLDVWLRTALKGMVQERLLDRGAPLYSLLRPEGVRQLVDEHLQAKMDHRRGLFLLLTLDAWMRAFKV